MTGKVTREIRYTQGGCMTITSSGPWCDVGGHYILPLDPEELVHGFRLEGISSDLDACNEHFKMLKVASEAGDWHLLPEGPLRSAFENQEARDQSDSTEE